MRPDYPTLSLSGNPKQLQVALTSASRIPTNETSPVGSIPTSPQNGTSTKRASPRAKNNNLSVSNTSHFYDKPFVVAACSMPATSSDIDDQIQTLTLIPAPVALVPATASTRLLGDRASPREIEKDKKSAKQTFTERDRERTVPVIARTLELPMASSSSVLDYGGDKSSNGNNPNRGWGPSKIRRRTDSGGESEIIIFSGQDQALNTQNNIYGGGSAGNDQQLTLRELRGKTPGTVEARTAVLTPNIETLPLAPNFVDGASYALVYRPRSSPWDNK